jgi:Transposase zinc-binding domain
MPITATLKQFLRDTIPDWDHNGTPLNVRDNLWKIVKCGTPALGAEVFASTTSQNIVYHTCKSRFCPSCGARNAGIWQAKLEVAIPDIPYREINFTIRLRQRETFFGVVTMRAAISLSCWAGGRQQHDASPFHYAQRKRSAPGLGFQHPPLLRTQRNDWGSAHPQPSHYIIRRWRITKGFVSCDALH